AAYAKGRTAYRRLNIPGATRILQKHNLLRKGRFCICGVEVASKTRKAMSSFLCGFRLMRIEEQGMANLIQRLEESPIFAMDNQEKPECPQLMIWRLLKNPSHVLVRILKPSRSWRPRRDVAT